MASPQNRDSQIPETKPARWSQRLRMACRSSDYEIPFTSAEMGRLRRIFSEGVCDYSRPGVEQLPVIGTWLSYGPAGRWSHYRGKVKITNVNRVSLTLMPYPLAHSQHEVDLRYRA